jgi:hypothetical protein
LTAENCAFPILESGRNRSGKLSIEILKGSKQPIPLKKTEISSIFENQK